MKKSITLSIITYTLFSSTITLSMFRILRTQKHVYTRMCHTKHTFFTLPEKNIFNASETEISTNAPGLLEDLYGRNNSLAEHLIKEIERTQKIIKTLEYQNIIAINHTYHEEPLNLIKLHAIETELKTTIEMLARKN